MSIRQLLRSKRRQILEIAARHGAQKSECSGLSREGKLGPGAMSTSWWRWNKVAACSITPLSFSISNVS